MIGWDWISVLLFCLGLLLVLAGNALFFKMIGDSNRRLPPNAQISYLFGHTESFLGALHQYKRLYPTGRLPKFVLI